METLRYRTAKLMLGMGLAGIGVALFLYVLLYPQQIAHVRKLSLLATDFGHYVVTPALVLLCAVVAWRSALIAVGDRKAVEATPDKLVLTAFWLTHRIAWEDIESIGLMPASARMPNLLLLVVRHRRRSSPGLATVKIALSNTELHRSRYDDFIAELRGLQARNGAGAASPPLRQPLASASPAPEVEFDADAALARYMARKAAGLVEAPVQAAPARPAFGRKGL